jgi:hypothetical protein
MEVAVAERMVVVCDLDPDIAVAAGHVRVEIAGTVREFDLCARHLEQFEKAVGPFETSRSRGRRRAAKATGRRGRPAKRVAARKAAKKTTAVAKRGTRPVGRPAKRVAARKAASTRTAASASRPTKRATKAVKATKKTTKAPGRRAAAKAVPTSDVRAWARQQGIAVNTRGRISEDLVRRYQQSRGGSSAVASTSTPRRATASTTRAPRAAAKRGAGKAPANRRATKKVTKATGRARPTGTTAKSAAKSTTRAAGRAVRATTAPVRKAVKAAAKAPRKVAKAR